MVGFVRDPVDRTRRRQQDAPETGGKHPSVVMANGTVHGTVYTLSICIMFHRSKK